MVEVVGGVFSLVWVVPFFCFDFFAFAFCKRRCLVVLSLVLGRGLSLFWVLFGFTDCSQ